VFLTRNFHSDTGSLQGMFLTVLLTRPVTLILLTMAAFYLWVYLRRTTPGTPSSAFALGPATSSFKTRP
jgi:hypothetical protein